MVTFITVNEPIPTQQVLVLLGDVERNVGQVLAIAVPVVCDSVCGGA